MRKLFGYLPLILTLFGTLYGYFDPAIWAYLNTHPDYLKYLAALFVVSESLAATNLVKSNSVVLAIFDAVITIVGKVLRKK